MNGWVGGGWCCRVGFQVSAQVSADPTVELRLSVVLRWTTHTKPNVRQMYCYCDRLQSGVWQRSAEERIETDDKGNRQQEFENIYTVTSFVTDTPHHMLLGRLTLWSTKLVYALCNKLGNVSFLSVFAAIFSICECKTFRVIFLTTRNWRFATMSTNSCILNMFFLLSGPISCLL